MKKSTLFKTFAFALAMLALATSGRGQTTVFSDNFSTDQSSTWTTSGQIGSSAFSVSRSGVDWAARRNTNGILELTNDAGDAANANGWVFAYASAASFSTPYNSTLASNPGLVTWFFNMRQKRTDPAGFGAGNYGVAFILATTNTQANNTGTGYAIVLGQSGSTDPIRLAKFSGGLSSGLTDIITSNTTGLTDFGAEYLSIKVTYNPANNQWELFVRNDGGSSFADPMAGALVSQGTAIDNTYTSSALAYMGGYWQGATAANETAFFDNVTVQVTSASIPTLLATPSSLSGFSYLVGSGPSAPQSFSVSGTHLDGSGATITAPANFEVSQLQGGTYGPTITLAAYDGALTEIWVRLAEGLSANPYSGNVAVAGGGATTTNVEVSGIVIAAYNWIGAEGASWQVATNWSPERTTPAATDIIRFQGGVARTITDVPAETIAQLLVSNNTAITFQAPAANTLTIAGGAGTDLVVDACSQLNISGANALQLSLSAGATGSLSGSMTFAGAAHRLLSAGAGGITFNSGSQFTAGAGFTGNPFGTTPYNSVVFSNGSTYIFLSGGNPFGPTQPNSVVVFQAGSLFIHRSSVAPAFNGRTYANFEYDHGGTVSPFGTAAVSIDNLLVRKGVLNFNMSGTPGHSIKGNIEVMPGATLNFAPTAAGSVNLNGTALQTISGGGTITAGANSTITINNHVGVRLDNAATLNNLTISNGCVLTVEAHDALTVNGTLTNNAGNSGLALASGASLMHNTDGVAATMERAFPAGPAWMLISSPVAAQDISGVWTPASPNHGYDFYVWDEPNSTWLNQKVTENNITSFAPGQGYLASFETGATTRSFVGPLSNGEVAVTLRKEHTGAFRGANLLGNPYPSSINWNLADRTQFADHFVYIYDNNKTGGAGYITVDGSQSNALIPPTQGFFVIKKDPEASTFTFTNAMRVHSGAAPKNSTTLQALVLRLANDNYFDQTTIRVLEGSIEERDPFDAAKFFSFSQEVPQVFSHSADQAWLALNTVPAITHDSEFTLGLRAPAAGQYTLTLTENSGAFMSLPTFVRDLKTGAVHNLQQAPSFSFQAQKGEDPARFVVTFTQPTKAPSLGENLVSIYTWTNTLYLNFSTEAPGRLLQVYDLSGRMVMTHRLGMGKRETVPLQLEKGVYIISISGQGAVANRRVMVW